MSGEELSSSQQSTRDKLTTTIGYSVSLEYCRVNNLIREEKHEVESLIG